MYPGNIPVPGNAGIRVSARATATRVRAIPREKGLDSILRGRVMGAIALARAAIYYFIIVPRARTFILAAWRNVVRARAIHRINRTYRPPIFFASTCSYVKSPAPVSLAVSHIVPYRPP